MTNLRFQMKHLAKTFGARPLYELVRAMVLPFRGEYATFEDAKKAAPQAGKLGYDNPEAAEMYVPDLRTVRPSDYPLIYWLEKALRPGSRIFDWAGNVGLSYYAFQKYISYPSDLDLSSSNSQFLHFTGYWTSDLPLPHIWGPGVPGIHPIYWTPALRPLVCRRVGRKNSVPSRGRGRLVQWILFQIGSA